jgi:hypothetical protein
MSFESEWKQETKAAAEPCLQFVRLCIKDIQLKFLTADLIKNRILKKFLDKEKNFLYLSNTEVVKTFPMKSLWNNTLKHFSLVTQK